MAIKCIERKWCPENGGYRCSFVLDTSADAANLPECCVGSMAVVADTSGAAYMVNASGEWSEI